MICPECGHEVNPSDSVCSECGVSITPANSSERIESQNFENEQKFIAKTTKTMKNLSITNFVLLIVTVIFEVISIYVPAVAFAFALVAIDCLLAIMVLAIIKHKLYRKLNPKPKKTKKKKTKNTPN